MFFQSLPSNELTETVNISQDIEDVLSLQKEKIVDDILKSYHFPGGLRNQRFVVIKELIIN